jgi:hypothetical protein
MPRVCPQPPDCPLYDQRLVVEDEALRQAILGEQALPNPTLADLIRAEALNRACPAERVPLLLSAPRPVQPLPVNHSTKEGATS